MAICNEQKAEEQQFDVKVMRPHLLGCLKDKQMRRFPGKLRRLQSDVRKSESVEVFCTCRLPEAGDMVCCDCCDDWFHQHCIIAPSDVWEKEDSSWTCDKCDLMIKY